MGLELEKPRQLVERFSGEDAIREERSSQRKSIVSSNEKLIHSITKQKDFSYLKKTGVKFYSKYFIVISLSRCIIQKNDAFFLGMKVSKKLSKKAVLRNKIKRKLRHLVRIFLLERKINAKNNSNISFKAVIIPKKNFETASFEELKTIFMKVFLQISKQCENLFLSKKENNLHAS